jgi:predicted  nucleic acid-binding Zn-ribbon protein
MTEAIFSTWRDEIAAELVEAQQALADAQAEQASAIAARVTADAQLRAIRNAVAVLSQHTMATALAARVRFAAEDAHAAAGVVARAAGQVTGARDKVSDLEQALQQIERLRTPLEADDAEQEATDAEAG